MIRVLMLGAMLFALALALSPAEEAKRQRRLFLEQSGGVHPGELFVAMGEELFQTLEGRGKTMADCDFGKGPGVLEGAYAELPRYFPDTDRVEDLDTRIKSCLENVLGLKYEEDFGREEVVALASYIASFSHEMPINVKVEHPKEKEMFALGEKLWFWRAGQMDLSCAACHDRYPGRRIRLSPIRSPEQGLSDHWPAYTFSFDKMYTLEDRINFCYDSIQIPHPEFYSEPHIALALYIRYRANGNLLDVPGFTR